MQRWQVDRVVAVSPDAGTNAEASYLLRLSLGEELAQVIVDFAAPASVASGGYAEEKLRPYLGDDEPPQRLVIESDGTVRVAVGPKERGPDESPRAPRPSLQREPQRARKHGSR